MLIRDLDLKKGGNVIVLDRVFRSDAFLRLKVESEDPANLKKNRWNLDCNSERRAWNKCEYRIAKSEFDPKIARIFPARA